MKKKTPSKFYLTSKRLFDLLFSVCVVIFGSPLFLLIALSIKLTSKGPVIYKSVRVKAGFKLFSCYKFRTMYIDADERLEKLLAESAQLRQEWKEYYKLKYDPRITRIGHFLRKSSLDELPQFFNVILGDMSVVGPRPLARMKNDCSIQEEIAQYIGQEGLKILSVKPGLTGLWQTSGRNTLTLKQRVDLDFEYMQRRNFLLDLRLIAKTIPHMVNPKGAF